jgi:RsiW-degrading membrane proteinase PrsW (M82 family)
MNLQGVRASIKNPRRLHLVILTVIIITLFAVGGAICSMYVAPEAGSLSFEEIYAHRGAEYTRTYIENYLKTNPTDFEAWKTLAIIYGETGKDQAEISGTRSPDGLDEGVPFASSLKEANTEFEHLVLAWFLASRAGADEAVLHLQKIGRGEGEDESVQISDMYHREGRFPEALQLLEKADALYPQSDRIKVRRIDLSIELNLQSDLLKMMEREAYRVLCDPYCEYRMATIRRDFLDAILPMVLIQYTSYERSVAVVSSMIAGVLWCILWYNMGRMGEWPNRSKILGVVAVFLGILSTYPTVWLIHFEKEFLPYDPESGDILRNLLFLVVTVGLREELLKLLFFLPVALLIKKEKNVLISLVLASLTGLGFAIEENISYFHESGGTAIGMRFLTANFFHMVLTGYTGYHLVIALKKGGDAWSDLMTAFLKMVFAHGLYDFLIEEGSIEGLSFLSMTVYIWLAREYLRLLFSHDHGSRRKVSLTLIYTAVMAVIVGMALSVSFYYYGIVQGLALSFSGIMEMALISFMFYYEFDERLSW